MRILFDHGTPVPLRRHLTRHVVDKVKRIRNTPKVGIVPCDVRGQPKGEWVEAKARILDERGAAMVVRTDSDKCLPKNCSRSMTVPEAMGHDVRLDRRGSSSVA